MITATGTVSKLYSGVTIIGFLLQMLVNVGIVSLSVNHIVWTCLKIFGKANIGTALCIFWCTWFCRLIFVLASNGT